MTSDDTVRAATWDDWPAVARLIANSFHHEIDPEFAEIERPTYEPDRALLVTEDTGAGEAAVAHAAAFSRQLTVPGAVVPAAHVSMVCVAVTHRRRGLLTRLMVRQLREVRDRWREPVAVLWASEGRIYPRYGYGSAAHRLLLAIDRREVELRADWRASGSPAGTRLRTGAPAALLADIRRVYDRLRPHRPGWSGRDDTWWRYVLADVASMRAGATVRHAAVCDGPDGPAGYALWRTKAGWDPAGPAGEVFVDEVVAADPAAYAALWQLLLGVDLVRTVRYQFATVDEPLLQLVPEVRRLGATLGDALWVRLVDVRAALAARRYAVPVDVVVEVTDPLLPENVGRWRLTGGPDGAVCGPTSDPADLIIPVADLGAAYLGGTSLSALGAAGRLRELRGGTLRRASLAFGWAPAPGGLEIF